MSKAQNSVIVSVDSSNRKLGKVIATYAPIKQTCPDTCKLKGVTCYAEVGFVGIHNSRMQERAANMSATKLAQEEANLIEEVVENGKKLPLYMRIHVSGDSKTIAGTKRLAKASGKFLARGGKHVWTYTHAWKKIARKNWGAVSALASVDSVEEANEARRIGYAPAIVVDRFPQEKAFVLEGSDIKFIPCPNELDDNISCEKCKLCMKADMLHQNNRGIAFAVHGSRKSKFNLTVVK